MLSLLAHCGHRGGDARRTHSSGSLGFVGLFFRFSCCGQLCDGGLETCVERRSERLRAARFSQSGGGTTAHGSRIAGIFVWTSGVNGGTDGTRISCGWICHAACDDLLLVERFLCSCRGGECTRGANQFVSRCCQQTIISADCAMVFAHWAGLLLRPALPYGLSFSFFFIFEFCSFGLSFPSF